MTLLKLFAFSLGFLGLHAPSDFAVSDNDGDMEQFQDSKVFPGPDPSDENVVRAAPTASFRAFGTKGLVTLTDQFLQPITPHPELDVKVGGNVILDNDTILPITIEVWDRIGPNKIGTGTLDPDDGIEGGNDEYEAPHGVLVKGVYDIIVYPTGFPQFQNDVADLDVEGP